MVFGDRCAAAICRLRLRQLNVWSCSRALVTTRRLLGPTDGQKLHAAGGQLL